MEIFKILEEEHQQVIKLFNQIEKPSTGTSLEQVFSKLNKELTAHLEGEERLLYPVLEKNAQTRDMIKESYKEHDQSKKMMNEIMKMPTGSEKWNSQIRELSQAIMQHAQKEENQVFPAAREFVGNEQAQDIGRRYEDQKKKIAA